MFQQALLTKKEEYPEMSDVLPFFSGLCSSCRHSAGCTFPRHPEYPVIQCEEFSPESNSMNTTAQKETVSPKLLHFVFRQNPGVSGLCGSCIKFSDCTYPKTFAGSLYCDEYSR